MPWLTTNSDENSILPTFVLTELSAVVFSKMQLSQIENCFYDSFAAKARQYLQVYALMLTSTSVSSATILKNFKSLPSYEGKFSVNLLYFSVVIQPHTASLVTERNTCMIV